MKRIGKSRFLRLFVAIFLLWLSGQCFAQSQQLIFDRVSTEQGLSQSTVNYILQDQNGFMWFATYDGLNRYDGYSFKVYKTDNDDSTTISSNSLVYIYEDSEGYIWALNNRNTGLDRFNPYTEKFDHFTHDPNDPNSISSDNISYLFEDSKKDIWVSTSDHIHRVMKNETGSGSTLHFETISKPDSVSLITRMYENKLGDLYVFTDYLLKLDRTKNKLINTGVFIENSPIVSVIELESNDLLLGSTQFGIIKLDYDPVNKNYHRLRNNPFNIAPKDRNTLCEDQNGNLWIGTETSGLYRYNFASNAFDHYLPDDYDQSSISDRTISSLFIDNTDVLWIGTFSQGICKYDYNHKEFLRFYYQPGKKNSLNGNLVLSIHGIKPEETWLGMGGGAGITRIDFSDFSNPQYTHYLNDPDNPNSIATNSIIALVQRKNGDVWSAGTNAYIMNIKTASPYSYQKPLITNYQLEKWTFSIFEDSEGILWGGTWGNGLWRYNDSTNTFSYFKPDPDQEKSLHDITIWSIYEDKSKNLWLGGHSEGIGVLTYDEKWKKDPKFVHIKHDENSPTSLGDNSINSIYQAKDGTMWVCMANGISKTLSNEKLSNSFDDFPELQFKSYHAKDGLPTDGILAALEDETGNIWFSTNNGISKLEVENEKFINYNENHGLQSNEFWHNAHFKNQKGMMFFGGKNGFNAFYPKEIKTDPIMPAVVITSLKLFNQIVNVGDTINGQVVLNQSIQKTTELVLNHKNDILTFEFAALHFAQPSLIKYTYFLDGYEHDWNSVSELRSATYTNLDPGEYTFRVKATNSDNIWSDKEVALKVIVRPPWYQTVYFNISLPIIFFILIWGFVRMRLGILRRQKRLLEESVQKRTRELVIKNKEIATQNEELQALSEELTSQNEQLEILNGEIIKQKEKISEINESLELKVDERTSQLNRTIDELNKTIAELDRFVYSASHDLSAPLKSMKGILNLSKYDDLNTDARLKIKYLEDSILKLEEVIGSLTEFSRNSRMELQLSEVPIFEVLSDCYRELKYLIPNYKVDLILNLDPDLKIKTDRLRLRTIANNLISNALKYQDENKNEHFIKISVVEEEKAWKLIFEDNGIGIAPQQRMHIFDMFHRGTEKSTGSGLGLYIVKETLAKLNGKIQYESEESKGTSFTVELPKM